MLKRKYVLGGLLLLVTAAGISNAEWPKMKLAKRDLQKTQGYLYAENAKQGPAYNATGLVTAAIAEVDQSIKLDSHNHHAEPTSVLPSAVPGKTNLQLALEHLKLGKEYLEAARPDQGGHREKALRYTNKAIEELEKITPAAE